MACSAKTRNNSQSQSRNSSSDRFGRVLPLELVSVRLCRGDFRGDQEILAAVVARLQGTAGNAMVREPIANVGGYFGEPVPLQQLPAAISGTAEFAVLRRREVAKSTVAPLASTLELATSPNAICNDVKNSSAGVSQCQWSVP